MEYWNTGIMGKKRQKKVIGEQYEKCRYIIFSASVLLPLFKPNIPSFSPSRRIYEPEASIPTFHSLNSNQE
jgi:hypothetical protein